MKEERQLLVHTVLIAALPCSTYRSLLDQGLFQTVQIKLVNNLSKTNNSKCITNTHSAKSVSHLLLTLPLISISCRNRSVINKITLSGPLASSSCSVSLSNTSTIYWSPTAAVDTSTSNYCIFQEILLRQIKFE